MKRIVIVASILLVCSTFVVFREKCRCDDGPTACPCTLKPKSDCSCTGRK